MVVVTGRVVDVPVPDVPVPDVPVLDVPGPAAPVVPGLAEAPVDGEVIVAAPPWPPIGPTVPPRAATAVGRGEVEPEVRQPLARAQGTGSPPGVTAPDTAAASDGAATPVAAPLDPVPG